jgi:hypothetical protein
MSSLRSGIGRRFIQATAYEGADGKVWFAGYQSRAPSIASYLCGEDARIGSRGRVLRGAVPRRIEKAADEGIVSVLTLSEGDAGVSASERHALLVPELVDIHTNLPGDVGTLREELLTSTTREDFRRIRRANFDFRVTTDPDAIREFHARHYTPLVQQQFPEDGRIGSASKLLRGLESGGELICADLDDVWVAGMFCLVHEDSYALMHLGIRDADESVRQKRVAAALIIRSLERGVELGRQRATLGRSLPFLGKGPVWFKVKWNGVISREPSTRDMQMFMDLRAATVRRLLARSPVIHRVGDSLAASMWLEPGEEALKVALRDTGRFPGVARWHVLAERPTLEAAGGAQFDERVTTRVVDLSRDRPIWLGPEVARTAGE